MLIRNLYPKNLAAGFCHIKPGATVDILSCIPVICVIKM